MRNNPVSHWNPCKMAWHAPLAYIQPRRVLRSSNYCTWRTCDTEACGSIHEFVKYGWEGRTSSLHFQRAEPVCARHTHQGVAIYTHPEPRLNWRLHSGPRKHGDKEMTPWSVSAALFFFFFLFMEMEQRLESWGIKDTAGRIKTASV